MLSNCFGIFEWESLVWGACRFILGWCYLLKEPYKTPFPSSFFLYSLLSFYVYQSFQAKSWNIWIFESNVKSRLNNNVFRLALDSNSVCWNQTWFWPCWLTLMHALCNMDKVSLLFFLFFFSYFMTWKFPWYFLPDGTNLLGPCRIPQSTCTR